MTKELYSFIAALAWPAVALIALIYIWRTDTIGKLTRISTAAQDIKASIAGLFEAQEKLTETAKRVTETAQSIGTLDNHFKDLNDRITEVVADVNSIRDQVDTKPASMLAVSTPAGGAKAPLGSLLDEMDDVWDHVNKALMDKIGPFDKRSTAAEAYAFAHGNRKKRISYDLAEEIGVLHSSIKSYRRRKESLEDWLTEEVHDDFVTRCKEVLAELNKIKWQRN
jgi:methyl-accepting chemotaxis protein